MGHRNGTPSTNGRHMIHNGDGILDERRGATTIRPPRPGSKAPLDPVADGAIPPVPTPAAADASTETNGRGTGGKFAPGNKIARGNPFARRQAALRNALMEAVGEDRLQRIALKLADLAEAGDVAAAKLLLAYTMGNPTPAVDPDRLDLDELRVMMERPFKSQLVVQALEGVDPEKALNFMEVITRVKAPESILNSAGNGGMQMVPILQKAAEARAVKT